MFSQLIKVCVYHSGHDAQVLQANAHFCKGALYMKISCAIGYFVRHVLVEGP